MRYCNRDRQINQKNRQRRDALAHADSPPAAKAAAQQFLPRAVECHDIMRNRKMVLKDAD